MNDYKSRRILQLYTTQPRPYSIYSLAKKTARKERPSTFFKNADTRTPYFDMLTPYFLYIDTLHDLIKFRAVFNFLRYSSRV